MPRRWWSGRTFVSIRNAWSPPSHATFTNPTSVEPGSRATTQPRLCERMRSHRPGSGMPPCDSVRAMTSASLTSPRHAKWTSERSSRIGAMRPLVGLEALARLVEHVDGLVHEPRQLLEQRGRLVGVQVARLQPRPERFQLGGEPFQPLRVYLPTPCSRATRPRIPFTSAPASGEA